MRIKIEGLELAHSELTDAIAAAQTAERFGVIIELTGRTGGGGWSTVNVIGRPYDIQRLFTEDGAWSTGDEAEDAEQLFYFFKDAKPVFG